jgi:4-diphosphocytidyl-2-C-methyl-D-erythritol kinase
MDSIEADTTPGPPDFTTPIPRAESDRGGGMLLAAPSKINLNLLVGPRRTDGFHPLDSYVARVTLFDRILLQPVEDDSVRLICEGMDCGPDEDNLAIRAARSLVDLRGRGGVEIHLEKRIPPGRGLGGGSSDAACVLWGLNRLWKMDLGESRLMDIAASLGSDVPMFLGPPAARMTGRGEQLAPADVADFLALLWTPEFACATGAVYAAFDERPQEMLPQLDPGVIEGPVSQWRSRLQNQLAAPAGRVEPKLETLRRRLSDATSLPVCVTGSGSALFALCQDRPEARIAWERLDEELRTGCVLVGGNPW